MKRLIDWRRMWQADLVKKPNKCNEVEFFLRMCEFGVRESDRGRHAITNTCNQETRCHWTHWYTNILKVWTAEPALITQLTWFDMRLRCFFFPLQKLPRKQQSAVTLVQWMVNLSVFETHQHVVLKQSYSRSAASQKVRNTHTHTSVMCVTLLSVFLSPDWQL